MDKEVLVMEYYRTKILGKQHAKVIRGKKKKGNTAT